MESLKPYHTFAVDVSADRIVRLETERDCAGFLRLDGPRALLGSGSDVLFSSDFRGTVGRVILKGLEISSDDSWHRIRVSAGEIWHDLVERLTVEEGIAGLENLALIPGTCGAAPVQNIGAYGCEFAEFCEYVEAVNAQGETVRISQNECGFGYRSSNFKTKWKDLLVITAIGLKISRAWQPRLDYGQLKELKNESAPAAEDVMRRVMEIRRSKIPDPSQLPNAGSFFKNPLVSPGAYHALRSRYSSMPAYPQADGKYKLSAGWLIDMAGMKGYRLGDAGVYENHALILVNHGGARPEDLLQTALDVIDAVESRFGIRLQPEVRIYGETGEIAIR
ncbi:MAG: UDP-N-acetylmuramate dehydrogenase [Succinivibrionaceae bacterium]|nr:UDP-N-acetylmuramate dehydrogenase [Succinivibrionaceae bacterium]